MGSARRRPRRPGAAAAVRMPRAAREMGSHQEVTSDTARPCGCTPRCVLRRARRYCRPNRGKDDPVPLVARYDAAVRRRRFPREAEGTACPATAWSAGEAITAGPRSRSERSRCSSSPTFCATQQPPAMHDQIHQVGAALAAAEPRRERARRIALPAHRRAARARCRRARERGAGPPARAGRRSERRCASGPRARALPARRDWRRCPRLLRERGGGARRAVRSPRPVPSRRRAAVAGCVRHAPGGMVRMERNSQGSLGGSGGSGGGGLSGGGGSVVAISGRHADRRPDRTSSGSVRAGTRRGRLGRRGRARGGPNGSSALLDPNDEIRATAGSMAPGTKAREEMLVRYHKKRKERHFKKKIRHAPQGSGGQPRAHQGSVRARGRAAGDHRQELGEEPPGHQGGHARGGGGGRRPGPCGRGGTRDGRLGFDRRRRTTRPRPVGKRTRRGVHAVSKGLQKGKATHMTGVSELATPDVPPGACA